MALKLRAFRRLFNSELTFLVVLPHGPENKQPKASSQKARATLMFFNTSESSRWILLLANTCFRLSNVLKNMTVARTF